MFVCVISYRLLWRHNALCCRRNFRRQSTGWTTAAYISERSRNSKDLKKYEVKIKNKVGHTSLTILNSCSFCLTSGLSPIKFLLCQIGIGLRSEFSYWKEIYVMKLATLPKMQKYVLFSSPWFNGKENENQQIFTLLSSFNLQKYGKLLNKFMIIEKVQNKVSISYLYQISFF